MQDSISKTDEISDTIAIPLQDLDPIIAALRKTVRIAQAEGSEYVRLPSVDDLKAFLKLFKRATPAQRFQFFRFFFAS